MLIRGLLAWLVPLLVLGGAGVYLVVRLMLISQFDAALIAKARALGAMARIEAAASGERVELELAGESLPEFERKKEPEYFQVWELDPDGSPGAVIGRSKSLARGPVHDLPARVDARSLRNRPLVENVLLPDGQEERAAWVVTRVYKDNEEIRPPAGGPPDAKPTSTRALLGSSGGSGSGSHLILVAAARSRDEGIDDPTEVVALALFGIGIVVVTGAVGSVAWTVRRRLAPVSELSEAFGRLNPDHLPDHVNTPVVPTELVPIARGLEELVARVRSTLERERRFTSSAAHELRTPLAEMKSLLDVRIRWPEDVPACLQSMEEVRDISNRLGRLTELLLTLARPEDPVGEATPINLTEVVQQAVAEASKRAADEGGRGITFRIEGSNDGLISTHRAGAECVIANLISNAAQHAAEGSEVIVRTSATEVVVINRAAGLTAADVDHLFEPFWQKSPSRTRGPESSGLGLGLTIAKSAADRIGGNLSAHLEEDSLHMRLRLPERESR